MPVCAPDVIHYGVTICWLQAYRENVFASLRQKKRKKEKPKEMSCKSFNKGRPSTSSLNGKKIYSENINK